MTAAMLKSMLSSGRSAATGKPQHVVQHADVGPGITACPGGDFAT